MEQTLTTDARRTQSILTSPRACHVQTNGAAVFRSQPETGGCKILHVSCAEENGGGTCLTGQRVW